MMLRIFAIATLFGLLAVAAASSSNTTTNVLPQPNRKREDVTKQEEARAMTIEFNSKNVPGGAFTENDYRAIRIALLNALNRRPKAETTTPAAVDSITTPTTSPGDVTSAAAETTTAAAETTTAAVETTTAAVETTTAAVETTTAVVETTAAEVTTTKHIRPITDGRRRRRSADYVYTEEDITFVIIEPSGKDGVIRVAVFVTKSNGELVPLETLDDAIKHATENDDLSKAAGTDVSTHYAGLPHDDVASAAASVQIRFWIPIIVALLALVIIILLVCVIYTEVYNKKRKRQPLRKGIEAPENSDDDDQEAILKPTHAPQNFAAPPMMNGDPRKLSDSWGCIVPYDQTTDSRLNSDQSIYL